MADILIRGMEMPKDCGSCVFCENEMFQKYCPLSDNYYYWDESSTGNRPSDCPLVPLPEGHGRLVDADALMEKGMKLSWSVQKWVQEVDILTAPTIVPEEGGGENG